MDHKQLMEEVLAYRKEHNCFENSIMQRSAKMPFRFFDGPPFPSGDPHFGHLLASTIKDAIPRYMTMKGYQVKRRRGRDCHGMPAESFVEKQLGLSGKKDIEEKLGTEKFVEACRTSVMQVDENRKRFIDHVGRRVDVENAYFTMDLDFMESVINAFKNIYDQNLIYKGFKVQGYCPKCATGLSNRDIQEGYADRNDPAITVKFRVSPINEAKYATCATTDDGFVHAVKVAITNDEGALLVLYDHINSIRSFPGGKVTKDEDLIDALRRETLEETNCTLDNIAAVGSLKTLIKTRKFLTHYYEATTSSIPENMLPEEHAEMTRAQIIEADTPLGYAIKVNNIIIDDATTLQKEFNTIYNYLLLKNTPAINSSETMQGNVSILARTTTPRTLPSNMFLATGADIPYIQIYDLESKEYYILAQPLLKKYFSSTDAYRVVSAFSGIDLLGLRYEPLFPYIANSSLAPEFKEQFFQVLNGEFVSTEDGTGIVHIAPAFGEDDFNVVANKLGKDTAEQWLFLPINEYGEFTAQVPDYQGQKVMDVNKAIIQALKDRGTIVKVEQISHNYPHCRRCDTPLIYRAITSRFVREGDMKESHQTVKKAEEITFIPDSIQKRFINGLESAPDRNISRNRYRGAPLPVRESVDGAQRVVIGSLDELHQYTRTGSANITKHIFIRHGETNYNLHHHHDFHNKAHLIENGLTQAQTIADSLYDEVASKKQDCVIVLSPLVRTFQTLTPLLKKLYNEEEFKEIEKRYDQVAHHCQLLAQEGGLINFIKDSNATLHVPIWDNVFVDYRIIDLILPELQDKLFDGSSIHRDDTKLCTSGESILDTYERVQAYLHDVSKRYVTKTVISVSHAEPITLMRKTLRGFNYNIRKRAFYPSNAQIITHFYDNTRNVEVDLHKPYVDSYQFTIEGNNYRRIPEVLDCRFESGTMPFGQSHYLEKDTRTREHAPLHLDYPADFIAEGLDQTRGWFRTLHIIGNAITGQNAFKNVIVNGLILAEDGKKMSKKLKNYPDPTTLLEQYGADSFRLYVLGSPVVRAEPLRFNEKGVEQMLKDFSIPLENVVKFLETYAHIDGFADKGTRVHFIRHAEAEGTDINDPLTQKGRASLAQTSMIEQLLRINPDVIYHSGHQRSIQTAQIIKEQLLLHTNKAIELKLCEDLREESKEINKAYSDILNEQEGKNVLIVGHKLTFKTLWSHQMSTSTGLHHGNLDTAEIVPFPHYQLTNELDHRILAELHTLLRNIEQAMRDYTLDTTVKLFVEFVEKLTNRYVRRSRRRFRESGMEADKRSAYHTLVWTIEQFLKLCAPFAPFITEHLYQKLLTIAPGLTRHSIHLEFLPLCSKHYEDEQLIQEVKTVRSIIKAALFLRAKNTIKVKQPLQKLDITLF